MRLARPIAVFGAVVLACALAPNLQAQTRINNSGTGGINTVKGQIFVPGNKRADGQVTVRLQSTTFGELTLITDQSGGFAFTSLSAGTYTLTVDAGDTFEIARESITIDPDVHGRVMIRPIPKTYTVPVYLRLKQNVSEKTGVVDAKLAQIPKEALKHYEKGLELSQAGKLDNAADEFRLAVRVYPAFVAAYVGLGKIYLKSGKIDDAINVLTSAITHEPNDFDANIDYGIALYGKKDFAAAEPQLNKAAQLNSTAVTPHYYLGILFIQTNALEKAQSELEMAKRLKGDKNFPLVHRYLGWVYMTRNMNKEAAAEFETYLLLDPKIKDADRFRQTIADLKSKS